MATATKYMTHYNSAADGYIELVGKARGLAEDMFNGLKAQAVETGTTGKALLAEFDKAMIDVEGSRLAAVIKLYDDEAMTMAKVPGWKNRKSELRRGIKAGLDPSKYDTFSAFRKAIDKATGGNSVGSLGNNKPADGKAGTGGGAPNGSGTSKPLEVVHSGLDPKVQEKLNILAKHLLKLDTEAQLKVLSDCDGAIHRLAKQGGRFANVNRKTG